MRGERRGVREGRGEGWGREERSWGGGGGGGGGGKHQEGSNMRPILCCLILQWIV